MQHCCFSSDNIRSVFQVLLIVVSSLAWILIATLCSEQNNFDIEQ